MIKHHVWCGTREAAPAMDFIAWAKQACKLQLTIGPHTEYIDTPSLAKPFKTDSSAWFRKKIWDSNGGWQ